MARKPSQRVINAADKAMDKKIGVKQGSARDKKIDKLTGAKWPGEKKKR